MKLAAALLSLLVCVSSKSFHFDTSDFNTAYGYIMKYGIPEGERIQKAEEEYLKRQPRIVGGSPSAVGQFKYQAGLIGEVEGVQGKSICGGSLISKDKVVTAAHCWYDGTYQISKFTVVLGSILLFSGGTRVNSSTVVTYPNWDPASLTNDVAVISIPEVTFSDTIAAISLPSGDQINDKFVGALATASGFGITRDTGGIPDDQFMSYVRMNVISNLLCSLAYPLAVEPTNICTSTIGGRSTCRGDSGGPLAIDNNGTSVLIGITSFGSALSCQIGLPAVFTRVTSYIDFLNENL